MSDGKVEIGVGLKDEGIQAQAQQVGAKAGKGVESGIKDGTEKSGGLLDKLKGKFSVAFAAIGGIVAGFSMAEMARQIVETGQKFEYSMSNVAALSGATGDELDALEAKAREMGASTTFSASEAADALGYMALAGWDANESMEGLPGVLSLAQAGQMDLAAASDLVTDYLSAFGMEADETGRMVDVLAYAQANANTTVDGLGMAFKNVAANAHAAGMDVETTSAAISMMANQGLKGSEAGTALAAVFRDMTAKAEDGAIAIGDQTVAIADSQGNYRDFTDILRDVTAATEGMGEQEKSAALMTTFTADSIKGLNLMLNAGADEMASFRDELYNSSGAAETMADVMTDNLTGDIKEFESALEELQLKIYDNLKEPLRDATQFATNVVVPGLTMMVQDFDKLAPVIATVGVALVAYRKNWDIVTAAQKLEAKAAALNTTEFTRYFRVIKTDGTVAYQRFNAATGQYQTTQSKLRATISNSTVAVKAHAVAQRASAAATERMGRAAEVAGKAIRTMAPVAIISAVMSIADSFRKAAENAETLETATDGLSGALNRIGESSVGIQQVADDYELSASEIVQSSRDAIKAQADLADSIGDAFADAKASNSLVDTYTSTIERLAGKSNLTAKEQGELNAAVDGLNDTCGTTYEIVDAVNGQLNVSTDELKKNSEAWKKNAEAQAYQEAYQQAVQNRIKQEEELAAITEKLQGIDEGYTLQLGDVRVFEDFAAASANELKDQRDAQSEATEAARATEDRLYQMMTDSSAAVQENAQATGEAAQANADNAEAMDGAAGSAQVLREANEGILKDIGEAMEKSSAFAQAMEVSGISAEQLAYKLEDTGVSASDLASSIEDVQDRTANAFEKIEEASEASLDDMIETLSENRRATENWSSNIATLYDRAGSESERRFIQYMSSLGPEYGRQVQALVDDTSGKLTTLANEWEAGMNAGSEAAITSAGLMREGVGAEIAAGGEQMYAEGQNYDAQLGQGVADNSETATAQATTVASDTVSAMASEARAKMPLVKAEMTSGMSGATESARATGKTGGTRAGSEAVSAEISAMNAKKPLMTTTGTAVAQAGATGAASQNGSTGPYAKAGQGGGGAYGSGLGSKKPLANTKASEIGSSAASNMDKSSQARTSGQNLGQGFIDGMGSMLSGVIRGAANLAQSAVDKIKSVGKQGSPWRTTIESGRFAGEGLAVGIEASENLVKNRAGRLAKSAIDAIESEGGSDGIAWETTTKSGRAAARGLVVGFEDIDPMAQIEASIEKGMSAMVVAAQAGTMGSTTNNQTVNFNQPVQSPDQVARAMRMQQRYGLAGRR